MIDAVGPRAVKSAVLAFVTFDRVADTVPEPQGNLMSKLMIALFVAAGLGVSGPAAAQTMNSPKTATMPMSKDSYTAAKTSADAQYNIDKEACASTSGNANDICVAEAKGKEGIAKAEADAPTKALPRLAKMRASRTPQRPRRCHPKVR
jgi:hypothetical protein